VGSQAAAVSYQRGTPVWSRNSGHFLFFLLAGAANAMSRHGSSKRRWRGWTGSAEASCPPIARASPISLARVTTRSPKPETVTRKLKLLPETRLGRGFLSTNRPGQPHLARQSDCRKPETQNCFPKIETITRNSARQRLPVH